MEPSVHTTTSDAGRRLRNSAAASGQPGSKRLRPSMNVITMEFGEDQGVGT